ncbi:MAG: class F sortase [Candidatus Pacebacteria bacterium]|nr:class F sortase [Candidatus Paceibacterota bacterium]
MRNARIAGILLFLFAVSFAVFGSSILNSSASPASPAPALSALVRAKLPVRLTIPKIHVDAAIESVGLTPLGAVDSPKEPAHAAWFNLSPLPGDIGSSVIDGHFGWKDNVPAVFDDLSALRAGDAVQVTNAEGTVSTFIVRELRTYDWDESVAVVFHSNDGAAHLNLITCGGLWDPASQSYAKRLVVFTDKDTQ